MILFSDKSFHTDLYNECPFALLSYSSVGGFLHDPATLNNRIQHLENLPGMVRPTHAGMVLLAA